jgi:hypothetical protein
MPFRLTVSSLIPRIKMGRDLIISRLDADVHDRTAFDCGEPDLNAYLQRTARQHLKKGIANSYVLVRRECVAGFYRKFGFIPLKDNPLFLMLPRQTILAAFPEDKTATSQ